jgi:hypothetical protein
LGPELPLSCHRASLIGLRRTLSLRSRRLRADAAALHPVASARAEQAIPWMSGP